MIARILRNAGLDPYLPIDGVDLKLCDHDVLFDHLEKRAKVLKQSGYKDKDWNQILGEIIRKHASDFRIKTMKELQRLPPQKIDWFWDAIDKIDWKKDLDSDKARQRLLALHLTPKEMKEVKNITAMHYAVLECYMDDKFSYCAPTPGADDSYSDFIWSAVGCGKSFYSKLFSETFTWPREEISHFTEESFLYIFDDDEDDDDDEEDDEKKSYPTHVES